MPTTNKRRRLDSEDESDQVLGRKRRKGENKTKQNAISTKTGLSDSSEDEPLIKLKSKSNINGIYIKNDKVKLKCEKPEKDRDSSEQVSAVTEGFNENKPESSSDEENLPPKKDTDGCKNGGRTKNVKGNEKTNSVDFDSNDENLILKEVANKNVKILTTTPFASSTENKSDEQKVMTKIGFQGLNTGSKDDTHINSEKVKIASKNLPAKKEIKRKSEAMKRRESRSAASDSSDEDLPLSKLGKASKNFSAESASEDESSGDNAMSQTNKNKTKNFDTETSDSSDSVEKSNINPVKQKEEESSGISDISLIDDTAENKKKKQSSKPSTKISGNTKGGGKRKSNDGDKGNKTAKNSKKGDGGLIRLKKCLHVLGKRLNYVKLFERIPKIKDQKAKLLEILHEEGMTGAPSLERCRKLKQKKDAAAEVASLDLSNIIDVGVKRGVGSRMLNLSTSTPKPISQSKIVDSEEDDHVSGRRILKLNPALFDDDSE